MLERGMESRQFITTFTQNVRKCKSMREENLRKEPQPFRTCRPVNVVVKERGCSYTIALAIPMPIMNGTLNLLVAVRANFTFFIKFSNLPY